MTPWFRIGVMASGLWFGVIFIASELSRDFEWFPHSYMDAYASYIEFGPAFYVALAGLAMIWCICLGVPWVTDSLRTGKNN